MQKYTRGSNGQQRLLSGLVILFGVFLLFLVLRKKPQTNQQAIPLNINNPMLTATERYNAIVEWILANTNIDVRRAHWIAAKSAHETGRWTSAIFRENHNLFGMKEPSIRQNLVTGTSRGHATFNTNHDSMVDYIYYLRHFRNNPNEHTSLMHWIRRLKQDMYFEDTIANYYNGTLNNLRLEQRQAEIASPASGRIISGWTTPVILRNRLTI